MLRAKNLFYEAKLDGLDDLAEATFDQHGMTLADIEGRLRDSEVGQELSRVSYEQSAFAFANLEGMLHKEIGKLLRERSFLKDKLEQELRRNAELTSKTSQLELENSAW